MKLIIHNVDSFTSSRRQADFSGVAPAILVWPFHDAPEEFKMISPHGGDEDWVAYIPKGMSRPEWTREGTPFGCSSVTEHQCLIDGSLILIGAHA